MRLGKSEGETLLVELMPYPSPKANQWLYQRYVRYTTKADDFNDQLAKRLELLSGFLARARRELIVCYGLAHREHYKRLFKGAECAPRAVQIAVGAAIDMTAASHFDVLAVDQRAVSVDEVQGIDPAGSGATAPGPDAMPEIADDAKPAGYHVRNLRMMRDSHAHGAATGGGWVGRAVC
ncbi:MAG: hypothetical protein K0S56_1727 [Microvirga sp.]|nr:hypothetical protein [Microvirga sp.]